jgi:hypothetical protein
MEYLRRFWAAWKKFGQMMGDVIARVVLTLFYFTVFLPFGLFMRLFRDPLDIKKQVPSGWQTRQTNDLTLEDGKRLT